MSVPTKIERVLRHLASGQSLNRFDAERELHDHCLHSTVSEIQARGIPVFREMEKVRGYQGCPTRVARYRIAAKEDCDRARELLKWMLVNRKPAVGAAGSRDDKADTARRAHVSCKA